MAPAADDPARADRVLAESRLPMAGVFDELSGAFASGRAALSNFLELVSLEARRAGLALAWMVAGAFAAAVFIVAAWLALMAAVAMWAVSLGTPPIAAVIAVALLKGLAGAVLIYACFVMSRDLLFAATRRQVAGELPARPIAP